MICGERIWMSCKFWKYRDNNEQKNNIELLIFEVIIQYKYMVNNNKYTYIGNKMGQVQLTVKVSSNRTLPRFEEPILG